MDVTLGKSLPIPAETFNPERQQYRSTVFLDHLQSEFQSDHNMHLAVTDLDLYVPDLDFVFGEASPATWTAIFSTARLDPLFYHEPKNLQMLTRRAMIEAVHEMGHVLGLQHCSNPRCVMWFSNQLEETDRKGTHFCSQHRAQVDHLLGEWKTQAPFIPMR